MPEGASRHQGAAGHAWAGLPLRLRLAPAVLAAAAMLGGALWHGLPLLRSDLASQGARLQADTWARQGKGWTVESWQEARGSLLRALELAPADPVLHVSLAQLYVTQGLVAWADDEQRTAYFEEALLHQKRALELRPTDGFTWAQVALATLALRQPVQQTQQAWAQALRYAPREAPVQRALLEVTLARWEEVPPEMQAWARQLWAEAPPALRKRYEADARKWGRAEAFPR